MLDTHVLAEKKLAAIGQRYSDGRRQLVGVLEQAGHPLVAADIVEAASNLPQSSVYRNLAVLESAGVVVKVLTTGDRAAFELAEEMKGHHHHVVCVGCGQVLDIEIPDHVEKLLDEGLAPAAQAAGFTLVGHRLDLLGRCGACGVTAEQ